MKLFLSSYWIPDVEKFVGFVGKEANAIKFGLILNAKDYRDTDYRNEKLIELTSYFSGLGFKVEEIDLRDYTDPQELQERLETFDVIWANGGNTYMLRYAIQKSGGNIAIPIAIKNGVIYGGDSAGSIVVGPTLKYFSGADDPTVAPNVIYDGLNIVDFSILPHWGSEEYGDVLGNIEKSLIDDEFKTLRLTNEEFVLVVDGQIVG